MCMLFFKLNLYVHLQTPWWLPSLTTLPRSLKRYDCYAGFRYGLSTQGSLDVIFNCKATCDVTARQALARQHRSDGEDCSDDSGFADVAGDNCAAWQGYDCLAAVSAWGHSPDGQDRLLERCPRTCKVCDPPLKALFTV